MSSLRTASGTVLVLFVICALPAGCPSGGAPTGNGGAHQALNVPTDAAAAKRIDAAGGELAVPEDHQDASGVKLVVPPGAVPAGQSADFYVRVVRRYAALKIVFDQTDAVRAAAQYDAPRDGVVLHPLYAALIDAAYTPTGIGPVLEFGPDDVEFQEPLEIHIPFEKDRVDAEEAKLLTIYSGRLGDGDFSGARATDIRVDYEAGIVIARVTHLSTWQAVKRILSPIGHRIAGLIARPFLSLPEVGSLTNEIVQELVCSGFRPHVKANRLPDPVYFLYYLSSPMDATPAELDPEQNALDRQYYQGRRVVTGQEVPLEDWLLAQPQDSVTLAQLFGQAFRHTEGDVFQALLLTHNVLRGFDGLNRYGTIRGDALHSRLKQTFGGDEIGHRYHYFGMASFAFVMRLYGGISSDFYRGLEVPIFDVDEELVRATIYLEECLVSGDCLTNPDDYAVDLAGRDTGQDLADVVFQGFAFGAGRFEGVDLGEVSDRFGVDDGACLTVEIQGEREYVVGEEVSLQAVISGGTPPYTVSWLRLGQTLATGLAFSHSFPEPGSYTLRVSVTDASSLGKELGVTVTVRAAAPPSAEWLVYYVDNVRCWDAPTLGITTRSDFDTWRSTASYSGGGVDHSIQAIKVELQGGFASAQAALDWVCPRFTSRFQHYWCGQHVWMDGQYWWPYLDCDFNSLPVDTTYRE